MRACMTDRLSEPDDDALGQNEVPYLLKDLYTVAGLADERGWPVERYDYDAYGKVHMNRCAVLPRAADFDGDGDVDGDDLSVFDAAYKESGNEPNGVRGWRADLDGDGDVDGSDYLLFADAYNGSGVAPRGEMSLQSGSMVVSRVGNPFFFTGRRLDVMDKQDAGTPHHFTDDYAGLQLYDYRARTMDPVLGRFGQREPLDGKDHPGQQYQESQDPFEYVRSSPMVWVDWEGQKSSPPVAPGEPVASSKGGGSGGDCGISVKQTPFCVGGSKGHTWIEWGGGGEGNTADFPAGWINGNHSCERDYVNNEWRLKAPANKSCDDTKKCLKEAEKEWNDGRGYCFPGTTCRSFAEYALKKCGLKMPFWPSKIDPWMPLKYCCSACSKIPDSLQ